MNEDNIPQPQTDGATEGVNDLAESEQSSEKVFDITEDSISPIEDMPTTVAQKVPVVQKQNVSYVKPAAAIPLQDFSASLDKARTAPKAAPNITPISEIEQKYRKEIVKETVPETPVLKKLRTYESDVADVLSRKRTSTASIAIAENRKNDGEDSIGNAEKSRAGKKTLLALLSLILIGAGVTGAYYLYSISPLAPVTPVVSAPRAAQSLIPSDAKAIIFVDGQNNIQIQSLIQNEADKTQEPNTIKEIVLAKNINDQGVRINGPELLQLMDIKPPDNLSRSLTEQSMIGVYADGQGQKNLFIVATTNFFQNAFAGMLQWESVMADDLKQYLYPSNGPYGIANAPEYTPATDSAATSTTSSSTPPIQPYFTIRGQFEDRIVKNKDVRSFKTADGQTLFLYSFIDTSKIVMTERESTLSEILTRLEKRAFIR